MFCSAISLCEKIEIRVFYNVVAPLKIGLQMQSPQVLGTCFMTIRFYQLATAAI